MTSVSTDRRVGINASAAIKVAAICASTANLTLSGAQTIDGIAVVANDRVFAKDQTDTTEIGLYNVQTGAWVREPDWNGAYDVREGTMIPVSRGTVNAATFWRVTNTGTVTVGTTSITVAAQSLAPSAILSDGTVSMAADFLPGTTATHDLGSKTYKWEDLVQAGDLVQAERADHSVTPAAGYGGYWTKSTTPTSAMFSDDADNDYTLNAVVQQVVVETATHTASITTDMVLDDTIPQNSEGDELFTLAITPVSTTSVLLIEIDVQCAVSANDYSIGAIFQDSTANALAAGYYLHDAAEPRRFRMMHRMAAGTTSSTTFKFRIGSRGASVLSINGDSSTRRFGGVMVSRMLITELLV